MAGEAVVARETSISPRNMVSARTRANMTTTGNINDAIIRRGVRLASRYANSSPFFREPTTESERRNAARISAAVRRMLNRNR